jgi:hypothetical protein
MILEDQQGVPLAKACQVLQVIGLLGTADGEADGTKVSGTVDPSGHARAGGLGDDRILRYVGVGLVFNDQVQVGEILLQGVCGVLTHEIGDRDGGIGAMVASKQTEKDVACRKKRDQHRGAQESRKDGEGVDGLGLSWVISVCLDGVYDGPDGVVGAMGDTPDEGEDPTPDGVCALAQAFQPTAAGGLGASRCFGERGKLEQVLNGDRWGLTEVSEGLRSLEPRLPVETTGGMGGL